MFNSAPHNAQVHNGGTPGVRFVVDIGAKQIIWGHFSVDVACQQIVWNEVPGDIAAAQIVFGVLRDETHIIEV